MGVAGALKQPALRPRNPDSDFLGNLLQQVGNILSGVLSGGAINSILPEGILGS